MSWSEHSSGLLGTLSLLLITIGCVRAQHQSQCSRFNQGGFCIPVKDACPSGYEEKSHFSNYIGCSFQLGKKCCAVNTLGVQSRQVCGKGSLNLSPKILNGDLTGDCDWPFIVSIRALNAGSASLTYDTSSHACAGVLIDTQWVLTSPFCVLSAGQSISEAPNRILVVAGEYNVSGIDIDPLTGAQQEQLINIDAAYFHPDYPYRSQASLVRVLQTAKAVNSNGTALLHLSRPITGSCSGIVCLPTEEEAANDCASYDQCVMLGWGFNKADFTGIDDNLLLGNIQLTSKTACDVLTTKLGLTGIRPAGSICQSPRSTNTDSCQGDEGGPILCSNGVNWVVRGVIPFNLCNNGRFNFYVTEVASSLDWIKRITRLP
ncbi:chymotrypsinogen A [Aplysia californica]|uniref:Chymotrypsinogen A n=1 Tax=Aplysia californica TaxID=6500 RepID=A0ABM1A8H8_APLCA|nr:chymotrypsinogen A [Aplysia californica]